MTAALQGATAAQEKRFKLGELYPQEKVAKVLVPREQWRPWPKWERPQGVGESA